MTLARGAGASAPSFPTGFLVMLFGEQAEDDLITPPPHI
jgi:hypothetical protein